MPGRRGRGESGGAVQGQRLARLPRESCVLIKLPLAAIALPHFPGRPITQIWSFVSFDMSPRPLWWFATDQENNLEINLGDRHVVDAPPSDGGMWRRAGLVRRVAGAGASRL